jgi:hypothetical protein
MASPFPFTLRHFFLGALSREEVSSACLAMLLEGSPEFRRHFFALILPDEVEALAARDWSVGVEADHVDVHLAADGIVVLIENKLGSGAKQVGQLLRYYEQQRLRSPTARIIAVYLAPRQMGQDEVERVCDSADFQSARGDCCTHLSWDELARLPDSLTDPHEAWVRSTIEHISTAITQAYIAKYERSGDRKTLRDLMDRAAERLRKTSQTAFGRWPGKAMEEIFSWRTAISLSTAIPFDVIDEPPYPIVNLYDASGNLCLKQRTFVSLAKKVRKSSAMAQWWCTFAAQESIVIPGVGMHLKTGTGKDAFYECYLPLVGSPQAIEDSVVASWIALESFINAELIRAGLGKNLLS